MTRIMKAQGKAETANRAANIAVAETVLQLRDL